MISVPPLSNLYLKELRMNETIQLVCQNCNKIIVVRKIDICDDVVDCTYCLDSVEVHGQQDDRQN